MESREDFGHWEMDTVVGKGRAALLVLTERKTLLQIIRKMPSKNQSGVIRELDKLERKYGAQGFRERFKSITMDKR
ncbi:MAG: hypothetical protein LBT55_07465 [Clostridiaceae bacterium]|nr:hypothetical protein [Clostridiaceae bacterium]